MDRFDVSVFSIPEFLVPLGVLVCSALLIHFVSLRYLLGLMKIVSEKTVTQWDNIMVRRKVINRAIHLLPATVLSFGLPFVFDRSTEIFINISKFLSLYYIVVGYGIYEALLNTIRDGYEGYDVAKRVSIRGFLQAFKVVGFLVASVFAISLLAGKSPVYFISGLGAFTAVLLLIFKDSILGLVAGIQLTTMDLVRKGDWIEMPAHSADGDIIDISMTTVRVRNFDMTVTAIPAYELVSSSFKNWRGMQESGGRRIRRAINIDLNSIHFLTHDDVEKLMRINLLRPYLEQRVAQIEEYNKVSFREADLAVLVNGRRLTNIGTFRAYITEYLKNHRCTHKGLIQMVRQLEPGMHGLPIEVYVFTNSIDWKIYEGIQADIFDHLFAILPQFDLRPFQAVSGSDVRQSIERFGNVIP